MIAIAATALGVWLWNSPTGLKVLLVGWGVTLAVVVGVALWLRPRAKRKVIVLGPDQDALRDLGEKVAKSEKTQWHGAVHLCTVDVDPNGLWEPEPYVIITLQVVNGALWSFYIDEIDGHLKVNSSELANTMELVSDSSNYPRGFVARIRFRQWMSERAAGLMKESIERDPRVTLNFSGVTIRMGSREAEVQSAPLQIPGAITVRCSDWRPR